MTIADAPTQEKVKEVRSALAEEWTSLSPQTPEEILEFYRTTDNLQADLDVFHSFPDRQRWTQALLHVTKTGRAQSVIDIGAGAGHDLLELAGLAWDWLEPPDAGIWPPRIAGVEPNDKLRQLIAHALPGCPMYADVADAPIETANVLNCIDVLEHIPDPETWLGSIAKRCKVGTTLLETCASEDIGTPLHLEDARGWHPGRVLQAHGWERLAEEGRLRIWIKVQDEPVMFNMLCICASRDISVTTFDSVMRVVGQPGAHEWRVTRAAESGLLRARSIWASRWWRETCGDVFVMVDSDIGFDPNDLESIVALAREKRSIVCGAYSVRDGAHLALRGNPNATGELDFGPGLPPIEITYGATGFMAVHRDVLDAMIPTLTLCHANQPWAMWPMFDFNVFPDPTAGGHNWLSEDWEFCRRARDLGFSVWLDRTIILRHMGEVPFTVRNMAAIHAAVLGAPLQYPTTNEPSIAEPKENRETRRAKRRGKA